MQTGLCLRLYLSESDQIQHTPALEGILNVCRQAGLQGVSVLRGIEGMGKHGVHSASFLELSSSLPLVIEIIDTEQQIQQAIPLIQQQLPSALIATWPVQLIQKGTE